MRPPDGFEITRDPSRDTPRSAAFLITIDVPKWLAAHDHHTHVIRDGQAVTDCCGKTPFELPRTDRLRIGKTGDP